MVGKKLFVIGQTLEGATSTAVDAALACWPAERRPDQVRLSIHEILQDASSLDTCAVPWVILSSEPDAPTYELIAILQDRHLPGVVTDPADTRPLGAAYQDGITAAPPHSPPAAVAAILQAMWNASAVLRAMEAELKLMQLHHGGIVDQMDKIDEELRLAAQLQQEFLPRGFPEMPNVEFKVLFRPAGYVSGDIYDVIRLDEEHVGFFVADAVGHGVPAALMTMFIKRSLRTKETDPALPRGYRIVPPAEALQRLNQDMMEHQNGGKCRFATACYGVMNCRSLELTFARAGHPFPMILRACGGTEQLSPDGGLLGVFPDEVFEQVTTRLGPGDRLLLYSDGFELAFPKPADEPADEDVNEYYTQELLTLADGPLEPAMQRLALRIDQQSGSLNQRDDLTALVLGVNA